MTGNDRGQIQYDFAVGVSILVMTIVVAFTFVPGLFGGVTEGRVQGDKIAADRVAAWLAEDGLGEPGTPGEIDADCTVALFDPARTDCGFDQSSASANVEDEFAILERNVDVSIRQSETQVYWQASGSGLNTAGNGMALAGSGESGGTATVSVATRPVSIDGYHATVRVRVW